MAVGTKTLHGTERVPQWSHIGSKVYRGEAHRYTVHLPCRVTKTYSVLCVCVFFPFTLFIKFVGRTSRGHTGERSHRILIRLLFAVRASIFLARRIQPFLSLVDCEVGICVLTISFSSRWAFLVPSRPYP